MRPADPPRRAPGIGAARAHLERIVADGLVPSAVLEIGDAHDCLGRVAVGTADDAIFDLASLTKVLATGLVATRLLADRRLDLDMPVRDAVTAWHGTDRASVTVRDLLAHASGLPAHAPLYARDAGTSAIAAASCATALERPPRSGATYSDLGFIVLGRLIEEVGGASLDALSHRLLGAIADDAPRFTGAWPGRTVQPTGWSAWRGRVLHGEVHDDNAAAMGGVAGHAGLFGSAAAVGHVARAVLRALSGVETPLGPSWAVRAFVRRSPVPGSSRALAWDTALPSSSCGPTLSARAIGHTGFTGTSLWIDPDLDLYVALLTNRVAGQASSADMTRVRRELHDIVGRARRARRDD